MCSVCLGDKAIYRRSITWTKTSHSKKNKPFIHFTGRDEYTWPFQASQCSHVIFHAHRDPDLSLLVFSTSVQSHSAHHIHTEGQIMNWSWSRDNFFKQDIIQYMILICLVGFCGPGLLFYQNYKISSTLTRQTHDAIHL